MRFEKEGRELTLDEFQKLTGAKWIPKLDFEDVSEIAKQGAKLYKKGEMTLEQLWLGRYFQKEIVSAPLPDIVIRWIDPLLGWGVFF